MTLKNDALMQLSNFMDFFHRLMQGFSNFFAGLTLNEI